MLNKFLIVLIVLILLMALSQMFIPATLIDGASHAIPLIAVAENLAIVLMLINGTFRKSRYFKYVLGVAGLLIVGMIFKILHLQGADELMSLPFLLIPFLYLPHFISKPSKHHLDYLKLISVFFLSLPLPMYTLNVFPDEVRITLVQISRWVLFVTFIDFVTMGVRRRSLI
jgi:hypothetical protein